MKKRKNEKWFEPKADTGWDKDLPMETRRTLMLKAHGGDPLASARALLALANVTEDKETREDARKDADYFFKIHRKGKELVPYHFGGGHPSHDGYRPAHRIPGKSAMRITPRTPRITKPTPRIR
jgi:hypothetical protein